MITYYNGDIFTAPINILIHSCNCFHTMGSGIAKDIKLKYQRAYEVDCMTVKGSRAKLGQFSVAMSNKDQPFHILNCYTQHRSGRDKVYVEYDKFHECMENVNMWVKKMNVKIITPVIGCPYKISSVNAGGDWDGKILPILEYVFGKDNTDVELLICKKE